MLPSENKITLITNLIKAFHLSDVMTASILEKALVQFSVNAFPSALPLFVAAIQPSPVSQIWYLF